MQIFVKHPSTNQTLVFDCDENTKVSNLLEWIQDRIGWNPEQYYILTNGKHWDTTRAEKTFADLGVSREQTFHLIGRLASFQKKN